MFSAWNKAKAIGTLVFFRVTIRHTQIATTGALFSLTCSNTPSIEDLQRSNDFLISVISLMKKGEISVFITNEIFPFIRFTSLLSLYTKYIHSNINFAVMKIFVNIYIFFLNLER